MPTDLEYILALRVADLRFDEERDRRYTEVGQEREKALKIKEQADRDALELDRQIRNYKDEKANQLREQLGQERGLYATKEDIKAVGDKFDAVVAPILTYIAGQQGRSSGLNSGWGIFLGALGAVGIIYGLITALAK